MTTKTTTSSYRKTPSAIVRQPSLYHRLDTLLHTVRCIAQYEDVLCELSHEVKRARTFSPEISDEVREIVQKIPSHDYVMDLDAVRAALPEPRPSKTPSSKKTAKSATSRKSRPLLKRSIRSREA